MEEKEKQAWSMRKLAWRKEGRERERERERKSTTNGTALQASVLGLRGALRAWAIGERAGRCERRPTTLILIFEGARTWRSPDLSIHATFA
jgi:hypothetical protein